LKEAEIARLPAEELRARLDRAYRRMAQTGAHYVVDTVADARPIIDEINCRLAAGQRP
jgi:phosphonoacetaldehyde hydrolase